MTMNQYSEHKLEKEYFQNNRIWIRLQKLSYVSYVYLGFFFIDFLNMLWRNGKC